MGQQHRVKTKRKRRKAYLQRNKETASAPRRDAAPKAKSKKAS